MSSHDTAAKPARTPALPDRDPQSDDGKEHVLQVERRDYTDLAPTDRPRRQSLRGFDPIYTDIVDYIVRCTHRIWDERDVGLIYTHYTHNAVMYSALGTVYDREDIVRDTIQRLVTFPERRGMATQVIWRGDDVDGFYTSHLVTGSGRHTQPGPFGKPTGRSFTSRTIADCMVFENRIFREWLVSDAMALVRQLGLDAHAIAGARATEMLDRGQQVVDIGENRRLLGQQPPEAEADVSLAHTDGEAECLRRLHEIYNRRMFGKIRGRLCCQRAVAWALDEGAVWACRRPAPGPCPRRRHPRLLLHAPAHLFGPLRGGRREDCRAVGDGGSPSRLRHAGRAHRPSPVRHGHDAPARR